MSLEKILAYGIEITSIKTIDAGDRTGNRSCDAIRVSFEYEGKSGFCDQDAHNFNFEEVVPYVERMLWI